MRQKVKSMRLANVQEDERNENKADESNLVIQMQMEKL